MTEDYSGPFLEILEELKIDYIDKGNRLEMRCIFHDDVTPSSGVYKDTGRFWCYSCELSLNVAQFYAKAVGEDNDTIIDKFKERFHIIGPDEELKAKVKKVIGLERVKVKIIESRLRVLSRIQFGKVMGLFDKVCYMLLKGSITLEEFNIRVEAWKSQVDVLMVRFLKQGGASD